jgi:hypothetical protein
VHAGQVTLSKGNHTFGVQSHFRRVITLSKGSQGCHRRTSAHWDLAGGASPLCSDLCSAAHTRSPREPCCRACPASAGRTASNFVLHCCCLPGVLAVQSFGTLPHGRRDGNASRLVHVSLPSACLFPSTRCPCRSRVVVVPPALYCPAIHIEPASCAHHPFRVTGAGARGPSPTRSRPEASHSQPHAPRHASIGATHMSCRSM